MVSPAAFYTTIATWLSLKHNLNFTLSGVMEVHKLGGLRQYSARIVPGSTNSTIREPEVFKKIFRDGPKGYVLVDITTGQFYSGNVLPQPDWRIQLTFLYVKPDIKISKKEKMNKSSILMHSLPHRRYYDRPLVEVGPGAFKFEKVNYPSKFLQRNLKKLIKLKEKAEARNKDLNV